ncbi:MAG: HAD-IA family hydrolase [Candidatus Rokubacteria bacterium]|nr:HAD-IA family hydrolase [Candidatus Rokubacteria bacterium]
MEPRTDRRTLRAILFDAGNTLLRMNYGVITAYLRSRGHAVTETAVEEAELRARVRLDPHLQTSPDDWRSTEGRTTQGRYLRYLLEGIGITDELETTAIAEWRRRYNLPVGLWNLADPRAVPALRRVREAGIIPGVVSNSNGSVRTILAETGLLEHVDFVIDSAVVGFEKPDPAIFRLALGRAGVAAHEAAYVGDLYSVDVLGARGVGVAAVLLDPRGFWGPRDCPCAPDVEAAVELLLGE